MKLPALLPASWFPRKRTISGPVTATISSPAPSATVTAPRPTAEVSLS